LRDRIEPEKMGFVERLRAYPARQATAERLYLALQPHGVLRVAGAYLFDAIKEVQKFATRWLWTHTHERPNMALGGITPKQKLALAA
jgi:hypothetical protein